jgi:predicted DsbA family dithiol-disulfide isomerase
MINSREDGSCRDQVLYEKAIAEKMDISGTPGFVVNGKQQVGWASFAGLEGSFRRALNKVQTTTGYRPEDHRCQTEDGATC